MAVIGRNVSAGNYTIAQFQSGGERLSFQLNYTNIAGTDNKIEFWGSIDKVNFEKISGADKTLTAGSGSAVQVLSSTNSLWIEPRFVKGASNTGTLDSFAFVAQ